jgi:hypothetical protein
VPCPTSRARRAQREMFFSQRPCRPVQHEHALHPAYATNTASSRTERLASAGLAPIAEAQAASSSVYLASCWCDGGRCAGSWASHNLLQGRVFDHRRTLRKVVTRTDPRFLLYAKPLVISGSEDICHWSSSIVTTVLSHLRTPYRRHGLALPSSSSPGFL